MTHTPQPERESLTELFDIAQAKIRIMEAEAMVQLLAPQNRVLTQFAEWMRDLAQEKGLVDWQEIVTRATEALAGQQRTHVKTERHRDPNQKSAHLVVAETLRQLAGWGDEDRAADELTALAITVQNHDYVGGWSCPMCEEIECDAGCPLAPPAKDQTA